jgi:hypothetical protein
MLRLVRLLHLFTFVVVKGTEIGSPSPDPETSEFALFSSLQPAPKHDLESKLRKAGVLSELGGFLMDRPDSGWQFDFIPTTKRAECCVSVRGMAQVLAKYIHDEAYKEFDSFPLSFTDVTPLQQELNTISPIAGDGMTQGMLRVCRDRPDHLHPVMVGVL